MPPVVSEAKPRQVGSKLSARQGPAVRMVSSGQAHGLPPASTSLDDDRCNGGDRERGLDLALGIVCSGFFVWQTSLCGWRRCARDAWGRGRLGELRRRPSESDGLSKLDGEAVAMTGAWSTSALGQPSAYLPNVPRPKKTNTALPFIVEVNPRAKGCASSVGCMVHHRQLATAA